LTNHIIKTFKEIRLYLVKNYSGRREGGLLGKTVLIIDDAYFMRNLIRKVLREEGYDVVGEAKNGKEGIKLYFELKPDIVTMDINMPDISGIEATRQILSKDPNAKIIAVTGSNKDEDKTEMMKAGAMEYLKKPFQPAFLLSKIENILQEQKEVEQEEIVTTVEEAPVTEDVVAEEDFFGNMEIEILDKPDESKEKVLVIQNEEDVFEFPDEYAKEKEKEKEVHALSKENLEKIESFESPTLPETENANIAIHQEKPKEEPQMNTSEEDNIPSLPKKKEVVPPYQIRPPRAKALTTPTIKVDPDDDDDMEEPIINHSNDEAELVENKGSKGVLGFLKNLFKIN